MAKDAHEGEVTTTITATTHLTLPAHPTPLTYAELNPRSSPSEFFGPIGTLAVTIFTPAITWALWFTCNETTGCPPSTRAGWQAVAENILDWPSSAGKWWDWKAAGVLMAFYLYLVICWAVLPGDKVQGNLLRDGTKKTYTMNGFYTLLLTLGLTSGILLQPGGIELFTYLYDNWVPLVSASIALATVQSVWVYAWSFFSGELLALGGNSGVFVYDFFMGRPLNPTLPFLPSLDLKTFNEVRPGIIGWALLNISCACEQYLRHGKLSDSMILVLAFEGWYCFDSLWNESAILNQMDITTDGLGFMLAFGNLTWVPFVFGLQARYLAFHPVYLGPAASAGIALLTLVGMYIFKVSNSEKNDFRHGKNPKNLSFMETQRGTKLLTSGWWGVSRHPNYLGDWIIALGWCLPTGFETPIPYFYVLYFVVLLVHRQIRDDEACKAKYGKDWDKYCEIVPWRIIPYVY
ncbi:erg24, C-14 sterol reductase [Saitozyma podzolica]|uniref:Delta(14)-sterol reductase ERG24 n=1 Tax=Saitozyma podzolica TaxID=1890683 RepID=A0A427XS10_9TREE|nr:erg24, C-14 sterol reductase [Saitozyma podzolica]